MALEKNRKKIRTRKKRLLVSAVCAAFAVLIFSAIGFAWYLNSGSVLLVDFTTSVGEIKAVNGINNGPKSGYEESDQTAQWALDATEIYRELGISYVRTHDAEYPYGGEKFIDIHCIFPDWSKDPDDESAYHFSYTDAYISAIVESGAEVFFRLGESIDPSGTEQDPIGEGYRAGQYTDPPQDFEKWAQVCEHIVRHYNEGWNNGFTYGIQYWEIWNEPSSERQWTGSMEEYYELYRVTARYLKEKHPDISVGGCAMSGVSEEAVSAFLQSLTADGKETPLDFFSWHAYTDSMGSFITHADTVRTTLDAYGYEDTISCLDEWNYLAGWDEQGMLETFETIPTAKGGAFTAASLLTMQNSSVDMAMYYDGQFVSDPIVWCGLYNDQAERLPGYYAFFFFQQLRSCKNQAEISVKNVEDGELDGLYACAASGEKKGIFLVNYSAGGGKTISLRLKLKGTGKNGVITRVNERFPDGVTKNVSSGWGGISLTIEPYEMIYLEFA